MIISQMTKYHKDILRKEAETLAAEITDDWLGVPYILEIPDIISAASFAYHGMLGSGLYIKLEDVDLTSVPVEHLASLIYCVTARIDIINVTNLLCILNNIKSKVLAIRSQTLSSEETRALVRAMDSNMEYVTIGEWGEVSLDITALTQYSGQGKCRRMSFGHDADEYREEVRSWAQRINWTVVYDRGFIEIRKEGYNLS